MATVCEDALLVEDNEFDGDLIRRCLQSTGFANSVHWVKTGKEGLNFLLGNDFTTKHKGPGCNCVVLLDLKLPDCSGIDFLRSIRSNHQTDVLPVIILTAFDSPEDVKVAYDLKVNSVIRKPVNLEDFESVVRKLAKYWFYLNKPPV